MVANQKDPKKVCDEVKKAYAFGYKGFHEDDVPVFLEYEHLPPEKAKQKPIYPLGECERDLEHDLVKSHEIKLLEGDRKEILERTHQNLLTHYSRISKGYTNPLNIHTCEEALKEGYENTLREIILQLRNIEKRNRWFDSGFAREE